MGSIDNQDEKEKKGRGLMRIEKGRGGKGVKR